MLRFFPTEILPHRNHSCPMTNRTHTSAFTLIELLVVIAVVAVLVSVLVPSLAGARSMARMTKEMAAAQQLNVAHALYISGSAEQILPGYAPAAWVTPGGPVKVLDETGQPITMIDAAQRYPWRLAPYLDYNFGGLYQSLPFLNDLRQGAPQYASWGVDWRYLVSVYPSLGMNTAFIGGDARKLGFNPAAQARFGNFIATKASNVRRPERLLVWCSAREGVVSWAPELGTPEGFFAVSSPSWTTRQWNSTYDPSAQNPGTASGNVSLRHRGRAVVGLFDGHAEALDWDQLQDMTRWSDAATGPTWTLRPR